MPRILVVEDQDDVRRMLVMALEIEGHCVDQAPSAPEGLRRLQETRYNLVLSDYAMPGGTGTWMLHEAARQGLLERTVALIVTAHPHVRDLSDVPVITKPLDLDSFLDQVRGMLASSGSGEAPPDPDGGWPAGGHPDQRSYQVELVLYVSSASAASIQARRNVERLLERVDMSRVRFSICDLGQQPLAGEADRVAFTPTLVRRFPEPRMWVVGSLREPAIVVDLLRVCGVHVNE